METLTKSSGSPTVTKEYRHAYHPLPQFLVSTPSSPIDIVSKIADALASPSPGSQLSVFKNKADSDTFHFHRLSDPESETFIKKAHELATPLSSTDDPNAKWQPKHIILCTDTLPTIDQTPLFDLNSYFLYLSQARFDAGNDSSSKEVAASHSDSEGSEEWALGEVLFYGEVVTSTQTMLAKNPIFLSRLPSPLVSVASFQLAGRGRGSNEWISPGGGLLFSVRLCIDMRDLVSTSRLVFVQYLFGLAVAEACRDDYILGEEIGEKVRLKWPNDIYAVTSDDRKERKKLGGSVVYTTFTKNKIEIVIGTGLNVLSSGSESIFSLSQLLPPERRHTLTLERTLALVLARFDTMWRTFVADRGSFDAFKDLYLKRWLHTNEMVTIDSVSPPKRVYIVGITPDHGLLRTVPVDDGDMDFVDLQPNGNSFDLMVGMIRAKT